MTSKIIITKAPILRLHFVLVPRNSGANTQNSITDAAASNSSTLENEKKSRKELKTKMRRRGIEGWVVINEGVKVNKGVKLNKGAERKD